MEIKLSYEEMKANHPDLVSVLVGKIRSSNSKDKNKADKDYEFYYSYGVAVHGMSFGDMINQIHNQNHEVKEDKSFQEIISTKLNSVIGLSLTISAGRTKRYIALSDKPRLFVDKFSKIYLKSIEDLKKEEDRISKLTPEEQDRETQEHINELSKMGGFIGLNVSEDGVKPILPQQIDYNVDDILDKISRVGVNGLTKEKENFLNKILIKIQQWLLIHF